VNKPNVDAARPFPIASAGFGRRDKEQEHEEEGQNGLDLKTFKRRFEACIEYWGYLFDQWQDDWEVYGGKVISRRERRKLFQARRSSVPVQVHHKFVRNLLGNDIFNELSLQVTPMDLPGEQGSPVLGRFLNVAGDKEYELAEVYELMMDHILSEAKAGQHLREAAQDGVITGYAMFRVNVEEEDETGYVEVGEKHGWNNVLTIRRVQEPCSVMLDPQAEDPLYEDGSYAFVTSTMTYDSALKEFGKAKADQMKLGMEHDYYSDSSENAELEWFADDQYKVVEYFERERVVRDVCLVQGMDGREFEVFEEDYAMVADEAEAMGYRKVAVRQRAEYVVTRWVVNHETVLQGPDIVPFNRIPLVPFFGDKAWRSGRKNYFGIMRVLKPLCEVFAKLLSAALDHASAGPLAAFLYPHDAIKGPVREIWKEASKYPIFGLPYHHKARGQNLPKPEPIPPQPPNVVLENLMQLTLHLFHEVTGMPASTLGGSRGKSPESARSKFVSQEAMSLTVNVFPENFTKTWESIGKLLIKSIPLIYDRNMYVRLSDGKDGGDWVQINQTRIRDLQTGERVMLNDLTQEAHLDLKVDVNDKSPGRQQEQFGYLTEMVKAMPDLGPLLVDLIVELSGVPGAEALKDRFTALVTPVELLSEEERQKRFDAFMEALQFEAAKMQAQQQIMGPPQPSSEDRKNEADARLKEAQAQEAMASAQAAGSKAGDQEALRQFNQQMRQQQLPGAAAKTEKARIDAAAAVSKALDDSDARRQDADMKVKAAKEKKETK